MRMRENDKTMDRDRLILYYPPTWHEEVWRESLPLGNGQLGALISGGVMQEDILINDGRLWTAADNPPLPDVSERLRRTRSLMDAGRYEEASPEICLGLIDAGYEADVEHTYPLARLSLRLDTKDVFTGYRRVLDMRGGTASVEYRLGGQEVVRRAFVSRETDTLYYEIHTPDRSAVQAAVNLGFVFTKDEHCPVIYEQVKPFISMQSDERWVTYTASHDGGRRYYGVVMEHRRDGGYVYMEDDGLHIAAASRVEFRCKTFVGESDPLGAVSRLKAELEADAAGFEENLVRHSREHGAFYGRLNIHLDSGDYSKSNEELLLQAYRDDFSPALARKLWAYGRYLYISATRPDGLPSPMYGLWHGQYRLIWAICMANINLQMMNWQAPAGDLMELLLAMMRYYSGHMDTYRDNARKLFGCRGIYIPSITTPNVHSITTVVPVIVNWTGGAGWLAQHFYRYYQYTGDRAMLRDVILPFMRECALFYEDFLQLDEAGQYRVYPSVSPENTPGNFMPEEYREDMGHVMPSAVNATMDIAIIRELLTNLLEATAQLGIDEDKADVWRAILAKLPPYSKNEDGALKEWLCDAFTDNYNHRHYSHLYPLFPGDEMITRGDAGLIEACREALSRRDLRGQSGWSFPMSCCEYARLGDGEKALDAIKAMSKGCLLNNFFTLHNDWRRMGVTFDLGATAPVQLDAIMGTAAAVQEMLVSCFPHEIRLLPALPAEWPVGDVAGMRHYTGTLEMQWNIYEGAVYAAITMERDTDVTVNLPDGFVWETTKTRFQPVCGKAGDTIHLKATARGQSIKAVV